MGASVSSLLMIATRRVCCVPVPTPLPPLTTGGGAGGILTVYKWTQRIDSRQRERDKKEQNPRTVGRFGEKCRHPYIAPCTLFPWLRAYRRSNDDKECWVPPWRQNYPWFLFSHLCHYSLPPITSVPFIFLSRQSTGRGRGASGLSGIIATIGCWGGEDEQENDSQSCLAFNIVKEIEPYLQSRARSKWGQYRVPRVGVGMDVGQSWPWRGCICPLNLNCNQRYPSARRKYRHLP